jgi:hypothetical protein
MLGFAHAGLHMKESTEGGADKAATVFWRPERSTRKLMA